MLTNSVGASSTVGCFVVREPEAAGDGVLPSGANGLQARQEARDFRREVRGFVPCQKVSAKETLCLSSDGRKSETVASLSSEAAGLRSEFFRPSGKPSTSSSPSSGKVRRVAPCVHHARFLLSRSVLHCADASFRTPLPRASGKARLLPALPAFVPHSGTPGADSLSGIAPLPVMPGLDAPGTSVRPLRLRVLRRVCRALTVSAS